jgi:hypothetical protein
MSLDQRLNDTNRELNSIKTLLQETHRTVKKTADDVTVIRKRLVRYLLGRFALIVVACYRAVHLLVSSTATAFQPESDRAWAKRPG